MSSVNYITARDLFLAHHWRRFLAYDAKRHSAFVCGRVQAIEELTEGVESGRGVRLGETRYRISAWNSEALREPKAAEAAPAVQEVLTLGDWIGVDAQGAVILFAPCSHLGVGVIQDGREVVEQALAWDDFLFKVRRFFRSRGFVEMTTPTLAVSPGTEPFLHPLSLSIESDGSVSEKFLITSPEFHLKRALAAGLPHVFEIAKCFRNREGGSHHRIEFHMLEWYRAFASLDEIAEDVDALIQVFTPERVLKKVEMSELFRHFTGYPLRPDTSRDELANIATSLAVRFTIDDDFNDLFHRLFLEKIEPQLMAFSKDEPLLVSGYPPSMSALARIGDDGFADRFEVYWRGLEICNAFHELNDPIENRLRFESDNQQKIRTGRNPVPLDEELLRSFEMGLPPAGGIAMGLERLFMAAFGVANIGRVRPFQS